MSNNVDSTDFDSTDTTATTGPGQTGQKQTVPEQTDVCVVGAGPAGMLTGLLLARAGVQVTVLEKYPDFNRDFRGDTIHPSTLELLHELGWLDDFLALPHSRMSRVEVANAGVTTTVADFSRLPVRCPFIVFVPQWDFLSFLAEKAAADPNFTLLRSTTVTGLITDGDQVHGVTAEHRGVRLELHAGLVIGADGRHSVTRRAGGMVAKQNASPIDVLWLRLPRHPHEQVPLFTAGQGALISIDRDSYWQLACVIPAGSAAAIRADGLTALRDRIVGLQPGFSDRVGLLTDWDEVSELTVRVDHLTHWARPGLLCIGDAAHAMSPAGGVGINLAIQDAVATANLLGPIFRLREPTLHELRRVQRRRSWAARATQFAQVQIPSTFYHRDQATPARLPLPLRLLHQIPVLRHLGGRFVGLGLRPEHVQANL